MKRVLKLLDSYQIKYNSYLTTNYEGFNKIRDKTSGSTFQEIFIENQFISGYFDVL